VLECAANYFVRGAGELRSGLGTAEITCSGLVSIRDVSSSLNACTLMSVSLKTGDRSPLRFFPLGLAGS
jgi:hypothetical protein